MTKTRQPFTNAAMREPRPGKPHIALIDSLWRVSPWGLPAHIDPEGVTTMPTLNELTTAEEFRNAEPGTYVVTGEASAELARQVANQLERKSFDNSTIKEPTPNKPHIVFVAGYWRVSTWKRGTSDFYYKAHSFIRRLNGQSLF